MLAGLGNSFSGQAMLKSLGIGSGSNLEITPRGDGKKLLGSKGGASKSTSSSGYVGNSSGSDIKDSTMQEAEDSKKQMMIEAKEEEEANQVTVLNETVIKIYELLDDVASGKSSFNVRVSGYGLTSTRKNSGSGAQGGIAALDNLSGVSRNSTTIGGSSGGGTAIGSVTTGGGSSFDLGGWTMT
jgi:hypothetical protein